MGIVRKMISNLTLDFIYFCAKLSRKSPAKCQEERWAWTDARSIGNDEKVLFVDLGSNLGQGYRWFRRYFRAPNVAFELFEPNPNCLKELEKLDDVSKAKVKLYPWGVGMSEGWFDFYGLHEDEGGKYSQGGSLVKDHNSDRYEPSEQATIKVKVINFSSYLKDKSTEFDKIIVKMDIEGAEVELLEGLLRENTINLIDTLYVEFHSQYQIEELAASTKTREDNILRDLSNETHVNVRIWH